MNLKASIAASIIGLIAGVACSSDSSPKPAAGVVETSTTRVAAFDPQAYCVEKIAPLMAKYPKSFADGGTAQASCRKMLAETDATSAKTIDVLLETAEGFYKMVG